MGQRGVGLRDGAILLWEYIAVWGFQNKNGGIRCHAQILGPLVCAIADKLTRHGTERGKLKPPTSAMGAEVSKSPQTEGGHKFKLNGELLHGGQGKDYTFIHFACDHQDIAGHPAEEPHTGGQLKKGLFHGTTSLLALSGRVPKALFPGGLGNPTVIVWGCDCSQIGL